jgi:hypothetical protein
MNPTAVHSSEVVGQLVLIEAVPLNRSSRPQKPASRLHAYQHGNRLS